MGSTFVKVIDSNDKYCFIEYSSQIEGGHSKYTCRVPKKVGVFTEYDQIKEYCKTTESGNTKYYNLPGGIEFSINTGTIILYLIFIFAVVISITLLYFMLKFIINIIRKLKT